MSQQDSPRSRDLLDSSSDEEGGYISNFAPMNNGFRNNDHPFSSTAAESSFSSKEDNKKRKREDGPTMESKSLKMMKKMGFTEGKGLGKTQQGIVKPIEASDHQSKRGLGFSIPGLNPDRNADWNNEMEVVVVQEEVDWLHSPDDPLPDITELSDWMLIGKKCMQIDNETFFCEASIVEDVVKNKCIFDQLPGREMRQARSRSNPFETIGSTFFLNRAAPKMANIDAVFEFIFTNPIDESGKLLLNSYSDDLFYFADVCAAPGGFSEYVLWRSKQVHSGHCRAKGFGFTLKENDFKLSDFYAASPEFLEPHYGEDGDGDIFKSKNIHSFSNFVLESTNGLGVHLMMADGGFSVEGNECIQEILSKQLYLCQFLTALCIVREHGNFVCKVFDLFTPFSIGLIYLIHLCFKKVSIFKPNTSRPANSERYLICQWKKSDTTAVKDYMFYVNESLLRCQKTKSDDVLEVVPFEILESNKEFFNYVCSSNNSLGMRQIAALQKIQAFCKNRNLVEDRQSDMKMECIAFWKLPVRSRLRPNHEKPQQRIRSILKYQQVLSMEAAFVDKSNLQEMSSRHDYHFVVLTSNKEGCYKKERGIFFGMGARKIYFYDIHESSWKTLETKIELPSDTIVFAELASEIDSRGKRTRALHLIDGVLLNGYDISNLKLTLRHMHLRAFAKTINRPTIPFITPIRCKELHQLRDIKEVLCSGRLINGVKNKTYTESQLSNNSPLTVNPTGVLFLKNSHRDWTRYFSKSQKRLYYYNIKTRATHYDWQPEIAGCVGTALEKGFYWWWDNDVHILEEDPANPNKLHLYDILHHLDSLSL